MSKDNKTTNDIAVKESKKKGDVFLPWKTTVAIILIGTANGLVSTPSDMSETWAWEVAKALISINGLLIGFSILGRML